MIIGASSRRSDKMPPTTPKVEAKLQPDDEIPGQVDKSLSRGDKITFINDCFRDRVQYLETVTNSEKISKAKEDQFWLDRRATSTCPFREGTYTTASAIKTIVTGTCTKRRRDSILASGPLPVIAHHADLQHAMDLWIPIWNLWDALSLMAKTQTLVLQILDQAEVEHHTDKWLGPADGPFTPIIFMPEVQEAIGKYVESLKRPWKGTRGEAMYPAEVELWPPHVSTEAEISDVTTDDDDDDKDAITSVEGTPHSKTSPEMIAKLKRLEAEFIRQRQNKQNANDATAYVSSPSTSPGAPRDSHPSSRSSKHSVLVSPGQQDAPGAIGLRPWAGIIAHAEASDTRGKASPKESNGEPSPQRKSNFEEKRRENIARNEEATGMLTLAANIPPKPRQPRKSELKSRSVASPPGERPMTRAQSGLVDRGQDTHARGEMKEAAVADQGEAASDNSDDAKSESPKGGKGKGRPREHADAYLEKNGPAPMNDDAENYQRRKRSRTRETLTSYPHPGEIELPIRAPAPISSELPQEKTHPAQRLGSKKASTAPKPSSASAAASGKSALASILANPQLPNSVTTNITENVRHPNRGLQSTHNCAKESYVGTSSSHLSPYFQRPSTPSRTRPHFRKGISQGYASENSRPVHPSWDQQGREQNGSLVSYPPRREVTARIITAPGGDREVATVTESPPGSHTYFDENGEPSHKGTGGKSTNPRSFQRAPSCPPTNRTRHPATPGSFASSNASSGLFVKTPEGKQCLSDAVL